MTHVKRPHLAAAVLAACALAACGDEGFLSTIVESVDDPSGIYALSFTVESGTGSCSGLVGTVGSITAIVTPRGGADYAVRLRIPGYDVGPYDGRVVDQTLHGLSMEVRGSDVINEDGDPTTLTLDGTSLFFGPGGLVGEFEETASGAFDCSLVRSVAGRLATGAAHPATGAFEAELHVAEAGPGCAGQQGDSEALRAKFISLGELDYELRLTGSQGDEDVLQARLSENDLSISGSYEETVGDVAWTVTVTGSEVRIVGDFFSGVLAVELSGDYECSQVLGFFGRREGSEALEWSPGPFAGSWRPGARSPARSARAALGAQGRIALDFGVLPLPGAGPLALELHGLFADADGAFLGALVDPGQGLCFTVEGCLRSPDLVVGRAGLRRLDDSGVLAGGPFTLSRQDR